MRVIAAVLALAVVVVGVVVLAGALGDEDGISTPEPDQQRPAAVSVDDIVDVPERWFREPVRVEGVVVDRPGDEFALRGAGKAVLVKPQPGIDAALPEQGDRVTVIGIVRRPGAAEQGVFVSAEQIVPA